jgi:hypothetical protein
MFTVKVAVSLIGMASFVLKISVRIKYIHYLILVQLYAACYSIFLGLVGKRINVFSFLALLITCIFLW